MWRACTIAALLDLGKPRALTPRSHDLGELVAEVATLVKPEARRREVQLVHERSAAPEVETDQKLLSQALLNLVLNAFQASAPNQTFYAG